MSLAPSALVQLDSACDLFSKAARGFRAVKVLVSSNFRYWDFQIFNFTQNIMLHLQEKAHFSLDEFRRGKGSPTNRYSSTNISTSPDADDDELSILGGKTRLVSKKEPGSPTIIDRSPTSHNPIVPLPLSPMMHNQVHPSVLEYLQSFNNSGHSQQPPQTAPNSNGFSNGIASGTNRDSYSDVEISPVSMYGMSTLPSQSYQEAPSTYISRHTLQDMMQSTQQNMTSHQQAPQMSTRNDTTFPQYFPVYDYGSSSSYTNGTGSSFGQGQPPILDANPAPGQRRSSGSPDVNMQSTWQDFVNNLAMQ
jgi:hypothetical protein